MGTPTFLHAGRQVWALGAIRKPAVDDQRFARLWAQVVAYDGAYEMTP